MHYHDEHPLESELACSKYMTRTRLGPDAFTNPQQAFKVAGARSINYGRVQLLREGIAHW
jgi:hypothetical protein